MTSIPGMKLREVIAHPAFDDLDIKIRRVEMQTSIGSRERLAFILADEQERLAPLPEGETADWRTPT